MKKMKGLFREKNVQGCHGHDEWLAIAGTGVFLYTRAFDV